MRGASPCAAAAAAHGAPHGAASPAPHPRPARAPARTAPAGRRSSCLTHVDLDTKGTHELAPLARRGRWPATPARRRRARARAHAFAARPPRPRQVDGARARCSRSPCRPRRRARRRPQIELTAARRASRSTPSSPRPAGSATDADRLGRGRVIHKVTWTGGKRADRRGRRVQFVGGSTSAEQTYTFKVRQTYSDGTVVDWTGAEDSDTPAPTIEAAGVARRRRELDAGDRRVLIVGALGARRSARSSLLLGRREARPWREPARSWRARRCVVRSRCPAGGAGAHAALAAHRPVGERHGQRRTAGGRAHLQRAGRAALRGRLGHRRGRATR